MSDPVCLQVVDACAGAPAKDALGRPLTTQVQLVRQPDGSWRAVATDCAVPVGAAQVDGIRAREAAQRLVPRPAVGIAPPGGASLVNIETLLWVDTAPARTLGTVTLLGHRVALRVQVVRVAWDFGDGTTATTASVQRRYDPADPCSTVLCARYWGHVYTRPGPVTVSARVTWSGQFQVDGGEWAPITGTVTGPAASQDLTIREARGVLVATPGQR